MTTINPPARLPLVLPGSNGSGVVTAADTAKRASEFMASTGTIYRRGDLLMRVVDGELVVLSATVLQTLLLTQMNVMHYVGTGSPRKLVPAPEIKESTMKVILGSHFVKEYIGNITTILDTSQLVLFDGNLITLSPGYNQCLGGIYVLAGAEPEKVSLDDAVRYIRDLFRDFQFVTLADQSRAIGAIFCAGLRIAGIYERHPLLLFEADGSQTGKTLMWSMICAIFGLRFKTAAQKVGGVGSLDESVMEHLVSGAPCILLDNMRGQLNSAFLEACLTLESGTIQARVPGIRAVTVDPSHVVFGLTSNGVQLTRDMANRALMVRLRKQDRDYEFFTWTDATGQPVSVRNHIKAFQQRYLGAVHAILRDWWANGAQCLPCEDHSFKETMGAVDHIVRHYFGLAPLLYGHAETMDRVTTPGLSWLRSIALIAAERWIAIDWSASQLAEQCISDGIPLPGGKPDIDCEGAAKLVGSAMSQVFAQKSHTDMEGVRIERVIRQDTEGRERKFYTFRRLPA